jgi:hypothetical protein
LTLGKENALFGLPPIIQHSIKGGLMEPRHRSFYCYLNKGIPIIVETRPDNFGELPYHYKTHCPNIEVAKMAYQTNLKIMQWRTAEN